MDARGDQSDPPDDPRRATRRARSSRRSRRSTTGTWRCCRRSPRATGRRSPTSRARSCARSATRRSTSRAHPRRSRIKALISARIAAGDSKSEIKDMLVAEYGPQILAAPPKKGFNLLAWLLPFVALFGGGLVLGFLAWRWSHTREPRTAGRSARARRSSAASTKSSPASTRAEPSGRTDPRSLPRGRHLDHHALRPPARAGLPVGRVGDRGRPARNSRSRAPGCARQPAVHRRLHGRLRRPRDRGAPRSEASCLRTANSSSPASSSSSSA